MLKIYGIPVSVHTRKVILAAREKGLDFENDPVVPFDPPAGWDRLSPTGKIPVVADGDLTLPDSSVIIAYLEGAHPEPPLYPADPAERARALWLEEYADGTLFPGMIHGLFFQKVIRPGMLGEETDQAAVDAILATDMPRLFGYLERALTDAGPASDHLAGGRFTVADIAVMSNLINYRYLGFRIEPGFFPKLAAYFDRNVRRPSIAAALAAEAPVAANMGLDTGFVPALAA